MQNTKTRLIAATIAGMLLAAGSAYSAPIISPWSKTFTITGIDFNGPSNPGNNVPSPPGSSTPGTLWLYAEHDNENNQITTVTLGDVGPALTPTNPANGNPVEYTLTGIVISGDATALPPVLPNGDRLLDIRGTITRLAGGGTTNYQPFFGVIGCSAFGVPLVDTPYTTADLDTFEWTGICDPSGGGPNPTPTLPDPAHFTSQIVTDATQFSLFFWDDTAAGSDQPEAVLTNLRVTFTGVCTNNCANNGGTPAPAPATLALLGLGLVGFGALRRRTVD